MPYHPIFKLISTLNNLANNNIEKTKLLIMYNTNGDLISLSDEED